MARIRLIVCLAGLLAVGALTGCQRKLFPENLPRSQYDRFSMQREGFTRRDNQPVFGRDDEIDLRSRLQPLGR
ncbi:MAG: hypothetical protein WD768_11140 [Phycisphaeraceae bacterium]